MVVKGLFAGCQFVLDLGSANFRDKKRIRELITGNGGQISYLLTRKSNYVVLCDKSFSNHFDTYKSRKATSLGIPVVSEKFVERCVFEETLIDSDEFIAVGDSKLDKFSKGKIIVPTQKKHEKKDRKEFKIDGAKTYKLDSGDCPDFAEDFGVVKFAVLSKNGFENEITSASQTLCSVEIQVGSLQSEKPVFRVVLYEKNPQSGGDPRGLVYPVGGSEDAAQCYKSLVEKMEKKGMRRTFSLPSDVKVGSLPLRMLLDEMKSSAGKLHPEVVRLVETVWKDSLGELESILSVRPQDVTIDQARNAEITLMKIQDALKQKEPTDKFSDEFYGFLPHNATHGKPINDLQTVARKHELCQLLKDVMLAGEAAWLSQNPSNALSQYLALKCSVMWLDPDDKEHKFVKDMISDDQTVNLTVRNIFRINRSIESSSFRDDLPNVRLLFHASSPHNYVGIFSRGLLLPNVVTSELGVSRSDEGNLGCGIYFSDSLTTSLKYAIPSPSRGSRLMLVNKVSLGKVYETRKYMPTLSSPPESFDSVKGVPGLVKKSKQAADSSPGFDRNEFAVYTANQQKMVYLVEFTLNDEKMVPHTSSELWLAPMIGSKKMEEMPEVNLSPAVREVESGLVFNNKAHSAKLEEVHVRAKVIDLASEVVIFQAYTNSSPVALEAKYVFPLSEDAAVCGFEAFINDKHVVGVVKEKEEAHREYKQAIREGHGAYLMDEEKPNVFTVSVGNIPPFARVVIKLTYVSELKIARGGDGCILFHLPSNISPWEAKSTQLSSSVTQTTTKSITVSDNGKSSLVISVDMPFDIIDLTSPTHKIITKKTASKACVRLSKTCSLGNDFTLMIKVAEIHVPRMWVERSKPDDVEQVAMVTFFPEFDLHEVGDFNCLVFLDMSNSMHGSPADHAKALSSLLIKDLPTECSFNVAAFGSNFEDAFLGVEKATDPNKTKAEAFLASCSPTRGGSDLAYLLNSVNNLHCNPDRLNNIFLISDGHLSEEGRLMQVASKISKRSKSQTRIFTFGIGKAVNGHLLQKLSAATGGSYEYFDPSIKRTWKTQLQIQLLNAGQPVLTNVWIDWREYAGDETYTKAKNTALQVPEKVKCLFNGSRLIAYSFKPGCMQATLHADICGKEFSTVVTASSLCVTTGNTLHRLAAKAVFKEYESGLLRDDVYTDRLEKENRKESIISLSIKHSVITKYTSFVAVEKREKDESETLGVRSGPTVADLVRVSFIDIIPEMEWTSDGGSTTEDAIDGLLKTAYQTQSSSITEARRSVQEAKELYKLLRGADHERLLFIAAAMSRLGLVNESAAFNDLKTALLDSSAKPNYDFLNVACKEDRGDLREGLLEVASNVWPDHCSIRILSVASDLRPLAISAFCAINFTKPGFLDDYDVCEAFWNLMGALDSSDTSFGKNCMIIRNTIQEFTTPVMQCLRRSRMRKKTRRLCSAPPLPQKQGGNVLSPPSLKQIHFGSDTGLQFTDAPPLPPKPSHAARPPQFPPLVPAVGVPTPPEPDYGSAPPPRPPKSFHLSQHQHHLHISSATPQLHERCLSRRSLSVAASQKAPTNDDADSISHTLSKMVGKRLLKLGSPHPEFESKGEPQVQNDTSLIKRHYLSVSSSQSRERQLNVEVQQIAMPAESSPITGKLIGSNPAKAVTSACSQMFGDHESDSPKYIPTSAEVMEAALIDMAVSRVITDPRASLPQQSVSFKKKESKSSPPAKPCLTSSASFLGAPSSCYAGVSPPPPPPRQRPHPCAYQTTDRTTHMPGQSRIPSLPSDDDEMLYDDLLAVSVAGLSEECLEVSDFIMERRKAVIMSRPSRCAKLVRSSSSESQSRSDTSETSSSDDSDDPKRTRLKCILGHLEPQWSQVMDVLRDDLDKDLLDRIRSSMHSDGYWEFPNPDEFDDDEDDAFVACFEVVKKMIIQAGALSFGSKVFQDILNMFMTAVTIEILKCFQLDEQAEKDCILMVETALKWLKQRDQVYPSLYSRLELGSTWTSASRRIIMQVMAKIFLAM